MAISMDPSYSLAYFNSANLYFLQASYDKAIEFYTKCLSYSPKDKHSLLNRGITKAMLKGEFGVVIG